MTEKEIPSKLWLLSKELIDKTTGYNDIGQLLKASSLYIKPKFERFDYKEGNISWQMSHIPIVKEGWDLKNHLFFIENVVKQVPSYHDVVLGISKKYNVEEHQADFWLEQFAYRLTRKAFEGISEEALINDIALLVADLENSPVEWEIKTWIDGIWLKDDGYQIYEGIKIRRTRPSDLEVERMVFDLFYPTPRYDFMGTPPAILELTYRCREQVEFQDEIENILSCLRLFKVGSVFAIRIETHPKSILRGGGTISSSQRFASTYKYPLSKQNIPELRELIEKIKPLLPQKPLSLALEEATPVNIALQRYNDALLKPEGIESRITSAITCLEALYLGKEERAELSRRLGQRASVVLRFFDFTPLEVYNTLNRAYEIRSIFIHGSQIGAEEHKGAAELAEKVLEYARVSLLVFLQLKPLIDKERFINRIDNALLDENAYSKLGKLVKENCSAC